MDRTSSRLRGYAAIFMLVLWVVLAGCESSAPAPAQTTGTSGIVPLEANAASRRVVGEKYQLTFQLGRSFHQPAANGAQYQRRSTAPSRLAAE